MFLLDENYWVIKKTKNHGRGLFVRKDIEPGIVIGDYLGKVIHPEEENDIDESKNFYLMYYHDRASIFPDLNTSGIHLINHSCTPNVWMYTYKGHTLFFALRRIFKGEEITVSYLISPQDKLCNPCDHICKCGTIICSQTMHLSDRRYNEWAEFHDKIAKKTKRKRVVFGQELPKLTSYPTSIPDDPIYTLFGSFHKPAYEVNKKELSSIKEIRKLIRNTGRSLQFPALNLHILGIWNHLLISEEL